MARGPLSLAQRFALANLAVGVALVASLVAVQTREAKRAIRERARLGGAVAIEQVAALCRTRLERGQSRALFEDLQPIVSLQRFVSIDVLDGAGRPLVQLTNPERERGFTQDAPGGRFQDDVVALSEDLADDGRRLGRLEIRLWVRGIQGDLRRIQRRGWSVGLALCAALAFLSWALGGRLSRRLRALTEELQRRDIEDFSPLEEGGEDEVARLAAAFNRRQLRLGDERRRRQAAEAHRQDMIHMIVHDMKGPLSVFRSGMPLLRERLAVESRGERGRTDARVAKMVELLSESSGRLLRLAEGILNVARVEDHDMPLQLRTLDLAEICRQRAEAAAAAGRARGIAVVLETTQDPAPCPGDADLLARVLDNLLSNALEHSPAGGEVRLRLRRAGLGWRLEVRDGGPGVPPSERARIFEKFRKGRAPSSGAGLGLAFCRLAVQRHGGEIGVEDPDSGTGAVFYLRLPAGRQA